MTGDEVTAVVDEEIRKHRWGMIRTLLTVAFLLALAVGGAVACGAKAQEPYKDAPTTGKHLRPHWQIVEAPDGFSNQATACLVLNDGTRTGIRLFSAYHGDHAYGSINQVADPSCR